MIQVTKSYLPDVNKFKNYIDQIYANACLTNNGPLVKLLEKRLEQYLNVKHVILVNNGTIALQIAYKALELSGEVITTPFSFVATTSSLIWEQLKPKFIDIDPSSFNLDPKKIESNINSKTSAILGVHVFGNPCDVEAIGEIARKHQLKVIYDAAHAFNVKYKNTNILNYGDISTLSFHATKIFHTCEGGAIITNDDELAKKIRLLINFGITSPTSIDCLGINAKMSEIQAAMGLCVLDDIDHIMSKRKEIWHRYFKKLSPTLHFQNHLLDSQQNYSYVPVLFKSEADLLKVQVILNKEDIFPRRYFYPSLDTLNYAKTGDFCSISRDISSRILCLPTIYDLNEEIQNKIISLVSETLVPSLCEAAHE